MKRLFKNSSSARRFLHLHFDRSRGTRQSRAMKGARRGHSLAASAGYNSNSSESARTIEIDNEDVGPSRVVCIYFCLFYFSQVLSYDVPTVVVFTWKWKHNARRVSVCECVFVCLCWCLGGRATDWQVRESIPNALALRHFSHCYPRQVSKWMGTVGRFSLVSFKAAGAQLTTRPCTCLWGSFASSPGS